MRKVNLEIREPKIQEEILQRAHICRLALMEGNKPYILPFNYAYHEGKIYIHCATEGKKLDILRKHPEVCFEVEEKGQIVKDKTACKWSTLYRSIVGYGRVDILEDKSEKKEGLKLIMEHNAYEGSMVFEEKKVDSVLILRLTIDSMTAKKSSNWDRLHQASLLQLESNRLSLLEMERGDAETLHQLLIIPEVDEFNTLGIPADLEATQRILTSILEARRQVPRSSYTWKILEKESAAFIGIAGLTLSNDKFKLGEIYYKLNPKYWNRGYATEVAVKLITTGFEHFDLQKLEAGVATENLASIRVLEKAGMTREGLRRKILPIRGEWKDNFHYAIVRDDYENIRSISSQDA
jgi:ribosomal-protein-alanine N-acetyltransferase